VKLLGGHADGVGEEESITLEPGDLLGRVLEAYAGAGHFVFVVFGVGGKSISGVSSFVCSRGRG